MNNAKQLYELQEVDLGIERKTEALTQVKSQLGKDDDLVAARAAFDVVKKHLTELEHQQKAAEWELSDFEAKVATVEKKLYSDSMKNPRELKAFQQDLELLKAQRSEREDKALALIMEVEAAQKDVNLKGVEFAAVERDWQESQQKLSQQKAEMEIALVKLDENRKLLVEQIDAASINLYEEIRRAKQGQAVAKLMQGRCQGCRISLSLSDMQRARAGHELAKCSNCGRILYLS